MPIKLNPLPLLSKDLSKCTPVWENTNPIPLNRILTEEEIKELEMEE